MVLAALPAAFGVLEMGPQGPELPDRAVCPSLPLFRLNANYLLGRLMQVSHSLVSNSAAAPPTQRSRTL